MMNSLYKNLGILAIISYIIGVLAVGFYLINDTQKINELSKIIPEFVILIVSVIIIGLLAFLFLILGFSSKMNVVYVKDTFENRGDKFSDSNNESYYEADTALNVSINTFKNIISNNQNNKKYLLELILQNLADSIEASVGAIYLIKNINQSMVIEMAANFAYYNMDNQHPIYEMGEGLIGQVAKNAKSIYLNDIPEGYIKVVSGLGNASPAYLSIIPIKNIEDKVLGVLEMASFKEFTTNDQNFLKEVALLLAKEIETNEYHNLSL